MQMASTPWPIRFSTNCTWAAASAWLGPTIQASCPVSRPNCSTPARMRSNQAMPSTFTTVAICHFLPAAFWRMSWDTLLASTGPALCARAAPASGSNAAPAAKPRRVSIMNRSFPNDPAGPACRRSGDHSRGRTAPGGRFCARRALAFHILQP